MTDPRIASPGPDDWQERRRAKEPLYFAADAANRAGRNGSPLLEHLFPRLDCTTFAGVILLSTKTPPSKLTGRRAIVGRP